MSQLPNEILLSILKYCDYETIMAMSYANKNLNNLVHGNWRHFPKKHLDLVVIALTNADDVDIEYEHCFDLRGHRYRKKGGDKWQVIIAQNDSDNRGAIECENVLPRIFSTKNARVSVEDPIKLLPEVISIIQERCTIHELQLCEMTPKSLSAIADTLTNLPIFVLHVALALPENDDIFCLAIDETARIVKASGAQVLNITSEYEKPRDVPFNRFYKYNSLTGLSTIWVAEHRFSCYSHVPPCKHCSPVEQELVRSRSTLSSGMFNSLYAKGDFARDLLAKREQTENGESSSSGVKETMGESS